MANPPLRIVSLVPSLSELVAFLDPESLVGRTRFCVYPTEIIALPQVGGTKSVNLQKVRTLKPDLVLAAKEENIREQVEELGAEIRTEIFNIQSVDDALKAILTLGKWMNKETKAKLLIQEIELQRASFRQPKRGSVIYLIWQKPWMTVGGDTYINAMLSEAGFTNLFSDSVRYPTISDKSDFVKAQPDYLLLSSEPYPFKDEDAAYFQALLPKAKVLCVDGTYFSWYGSRLKEFYSYCESTFTSDRSG